MANPNPPPPPVEHQFKPGESGNPSGRPKVTIGYWLSFYSSWPNAALIGELNKDSVNDLTSFQIAALRQLVFAAEGKDAPLDRVIDRTEGKVTQRIELVGTEQLEANRDLLKTLAGITNANDTASPSAD